MIQTRRAKSLWPVGVLSLIQGRLLRRLHPDDRAVSVAWAVNCSPQSRHVTNTTPPQTQQWEGTRRHVIKNDFLICSPLKAPPAAALMSLILFLERQDADIPDAFGLFKKWQKTKRLVCFCSRYPERNLKQL